jgi:hypothetical protein
MLVNANPDEVADAVAECVDGGARYRGHDGDYPARPVVEAVSQATPARGGCAR